MTYQLDWGEAKARPQGGQVVVAVPFYALSALSATDVDLLRDAIERSGTGPWANAQVTATALTIEGVHLNARTRELQRHFDGVCELAETWRAQSGTEWEAQEAAERIQQELTE